MKGHDGSDGYYAAFMQHQQNGKNRKNCFGGLKHHFAVHRPIVNLDKEH